jgi:hypothetical protein
MGDQPEFISIDNIIGAEGDPVRAQSNPAFGQEFHPGRF